MILFGRNRAPVAPTVRAVLGIRGEPSRPPTPRRAWCGRASSSSSTSPAHQSDYISVADLDRARLATHPWSIGGGGAAELKELTRRARRRRRSAIVVDQSASRRSRGTTTLTSLRHAALRAELACRVTSRHRRWATTFATGASARRHGGSLPYDEIVRSCSSSTSSVELVALAVPTLLERDATFGETDGGASASLVGVASSSTPSTLRDAAVDRVRVRRDAQPLRARPGRQGVQAVGAGDQAAGGRDEATHLALLGVLERSTACFWLKQVFHNKGRPAATAERHQRRGVGATSTSSTAPSCRSSRCPTALDASIGARCSIGWPPSWPRRRRPRSPQSGVPTADAARRRAASATTISRPR